MVRHTPPTLQELRSARKPVRNINTEHWKGLGTLNRVALFITEHVGSMGFFIIIVLWTAGWLSWNMLGPAELRFDPYPAFVLWLFISNMIQLLLLPLIMVGQNVQGRHAEARAEADFEVNVKAERELEVILQHLENQNDLILQVLHHVEQREEKGRDE